MTSDTKLLGSGERWEWTGQSWHLPLVWAHFTHFKTWDVWNGSQQVQNGVINMKKWEVKSHPKSDHLGPKDNLHQAQWFLKWDNSHSLDCKNLFGFLSHHLLPELPLNLQKRVSAVIFKPPHSSALTTANWTRNGQLIHTESIRFSFPRIWNLKSEMTRLSLAKTITCKTQKF